MIRSGGGAPAGALVSCSRAGRRVAALHVGRAHLRARSWPADRSRPGAESCWPSSTAARWCRRWRRFAGRPGGRAVPVGAAGAAARGSTRRAGATAGLAGPGVPRSRVARGGVAPLRRPVPGAQRLRPPPRPPGARPGSPGSAGGGCAGPAGRRGGRGGPVGARRWLGILYLVEPAWCSARSSGPPTYRLRAVGA